MHIFAYTALVSTSFGNWGWVQLFQIPNSQIWSKMIIQKCNKFWINSGIYTHSIKCKHIKLTSTCTNTDATQQQQLKLHSVDNYCVWSGRLEKTFVDYQRRGWSAPWWHQTLNKNAVEEFLQSWLWHSRAKTGERWEKKIRKQVISDPMAACNSTTQRRRTSGCKDVQILKTTQS